MFRELSQFPWDLGREQLFTTETFQKLCTLMNRREANKAARSNVRSVLLDFSLITRLFNTHPHQNVGLISSYLSI